MQEQHTEVFAGLDNCAESNAPDPPISSPRDRATEADIAQGSSNPLLPLVKPSPILNTEAARARSNAAGSLTIAPASTVSRRTTENVAFADADEYSHTSAGFLSHSLRRRSGQQSALATSNPAVERVSGSAAATANEGSGAATAHHRRVSTAGLDSLGNSTSTEKGANDKIRTFTDGNGVLHSEHVESPIDASVRRTLRLVRRKNIFFIIGLLILILVLTLAGGISVAFVNMHYTTQSHREYMEQQNRVVLNSSVLLLQTYQDDLQAGAANLMKFTRSNIAAENATSVAALRDHLSPQFFKAWKTWLFSSNVTATHSIMIPFCAESDINLPTCPIMSLSIACIPQGGAQLCTYEASNDNGLGTSMYNIAFDAGDPYISSFKGYGRARPNYVHNQTNYQHGFFLELSYAFGIDSAALPLLSMRRQENVVLTNSTELVVMCDSGSFFEQWFWRYEASLQKSTDSYSMLFRDNGTILAYGYGDVQYKDSMAPVPCGFYTQKTPTTVCGKDESAVLDRMTALFLASLPSTDVLTQDVVNNGEFTMTKHMGQYSVAYQDFLRFRTDYGENNIVFFAAYATPINSEVGRDGILQIVICVIIIFICMFLLGGVAVVSMTQMMKIVEVISQLATHAALYDTKQMRAVLDRQKPGALARLVTSTAIINYEFQRILANLNAYKPFLPQSLLTNGNYDFTDEGTDRHTIVPRDSTYANDSREYSDADAEAGDVALSRTAVEGGSDFFPPIADNDLRHILSNPIENRRLLQRGFHRTKSTILVASLSNVAIVATDSVDIVNKFVETVLNHAGHANGVVEAIEYHKIVVSFNSHFPVPRHQEKACLCALAMRESFQNTGCNVCIGISSGYNYVGTTGTEQQKARVILGESVVVAHALATLNHYLGCSIFANEAVVHEALVTAVVVDVVQLYYEHSHEWKQYNVSEIVGSRAAVLSPDMQLIKTVFKLVRCRRAEAALLAVQAYTKEAMEKGTPLPWQVQRLCKLVEVQQDLITTGYFRQKRHWQTLEGDDVILNHLAEVNKVLARLEAKRKKALSKMSSGSYVEVSATGATASTDGAAATSDTHPRQEETQIARALMDEQSKINATRRLVMPAPECVAGEQEQEEDTMFAIFVPNHNDDEDEESDYDAYDHAAVGAAAAAAGPSHTDVNRSMPDPLARLTIALPPTTASANASVEQHCLSASANAAAAAAANSASSPALISMLPEPPLSASGRQSHHSFRARHTPLMHPRTPGYGLSPYAGNLSGGRLPNSVEDAHMLSAESVWRASAEASSSPTTRTHGAFELPQRIVSVEGQVFHRTSHQIGRGSFGAVYLVISETGYLGAMKSFPLNQNNAAQLIREVETLSQMRHENIVGYDCCAVQDEYFFIICEYMSAGTLGKLIQSLSAVPERAVRKYARDVLFGLCYLHQHSWVHCDIKPENILMLSDGTCKLADFGAASLSRSIVNTVTMRGTARFSAPEAILGVCSKAGDVYSFGITLAQMVTGVHPWHAYTESDAFFLVRYLGEIRHALETQTPCAMQPDLPTNLEDKELEMVIHRCCEFDAKKRPTAEELLAMLS